MSETPAEYRVWNSSEPHTIEERVRMAIRCSDGGWEFHSELRKAVFEEMTAAVEQEREECAKIAKHWPIERSQDIADAILARGKPTERPSVVCWKAQDGKMYRKATGATPWGIYTADNGCRVDVQRGDDGQAIITHLPPETK